jgi:hypothetical protein
LDGTTGLIIGVVTTVVLGIIANLLTPDLRSWWAQRSRRRSYKYVKKLREFLAKLEYYKDSPDEYKTLILSNIAEMLIYILRLIVLGALLAGYIVSFFVVRPYLGQPYDAVETLIVAVFIGAAYLLLFVLALIVAYTIFLWQRQSETYNLIYSLRHYEFTKKRIITEMHKVQKMFPNIRWDEMEKEVAAEKIGWIK